jgi:hypothetical protein
MKQNTDVRRFVSDGYKKHTLRVVEILDLRKKNICYRECF